MVEGVAFPPVHKVLTPAVADGVEEKGFVCRGISKMDRHKDHLFQNIIFFSLTYCTFTCLYVLQ